MDNRPIKVLMFGWEFPPHNSGGLGTACLGLARALGEHKDEVDLTFVLPKKQAADDVGANFVFADAFLKHLKVRTINSLLSPYLTSKSYSDRYNLLTTEEKDLYGASLFEEVNIYARRAEAIAQYEEYDVIHAHDWLSFGAGMAAKRISGKPLVVQIHATEFDRTGGNGVNQYVYNLEKQGMEMADAVVAVSNLTKKIIVEKYGIPPSKIKVVHNGTVIRNENREAGNIEERPHTPLNVLKERGNKIVLFVGRVTLQKGPEYFLNAAKRVLEYKPDTLFVVAGSGDMREQMIREAAALGISKNVLFAGFLRGEELDYVYKVADLYVMPSVSEPFGLTALEAIENGTPVLLSKQSGVSEVVRHSLLADFWDTEEMASKILSVISHKSLGNEMRRNAFKELFHISWSSSAKKCKELYCSLTSRFFKNMK